MKNFRKLWGVALALIALFVLSGTSFAQDECFDLSEDDCELYTELTENLEMPASTAFRLNVGASLNIQDDMTDEQFAFSIDLSGAYTTDAEAFDEAVTAFNETTLLDVSPGTFLRFADGAASSFDAELQLDYDFPPEFEIPPLGPFELWWVDGVGYFNFAPLSAFDPSLEGTYGIDAFEAIEFFLTQVTLGDIGAMLEESMGDSMGGGDPADIFEDFTEGFEEGFGMAEDNPLATFMPADVDIEELSEAVTVMRLDDENFNGVDVIVFQTIVDLETMLGIDAIADQAYQAAVDSGLPSDIDRDDFVEALTSALSGSTVAVNEKYAADSPYIVGADIVLDLTLDIAPIAELTGEQEEGTLSASVNFTFQRFDINAVESIDLPEDAEIVPLEALLGGF